MPTTRSSRSRCHAKALFALLALLAATPMAPAAAAVRTAGLEPGLQSGVLRFDGGNRSYLLQVPAGLDPMRPVPLLVALHGGGGHAAMMADEQRYGLVGKAAREGFVVVFPNGHSRFPRGRLATWNAGGCCGSARDSGSDDVGFIRALIAEIRGRLPIDPERIFATGMSNGGMMAYRLACEAADLFRAVAAVAGTEALGECRPSRPVSVLHIHARNDGHVQFEGGAGEDAFRDRSKVMDFVSVPETVSRWVSRNHCASPPRRSADAPGAYCETYAGCRAGTAVKLCVTDDGGHSWPGAEAVRRGADPASQALRASDTIWDFFREVSGH